MTRQVIAMEGKPTTDGRWVLHDALTWPDKPIPIYTITNLDENGTLIGMAKDIQRESGGVITAEIQLDLKYHNSSGYFAMYVDRLDFERKDGILWIKAGYIRDLTLVWNAIWPLEGV